MSALSQKLLNRLIFIVAMEGGIAGSRQVGHAIRCLRSLVGLATKIDQSAEFTVGCEDDYLFECDLPASSATHATKQLKIQFPVNGKHVVVGAIPVDGWDGWADVALDERDIIVEVLTCLHELVKAVDGLFHVVLLSRLFLYTVLADRGICSQMPHQVRANNPRVDGDERQDLNFHWVRPVQQHIRELRQQVGA